MTDNAAFDLRVKEALDRVDPPGPPAAPTVGTAGTVNVNQGVGLVPHSKWLIGLSLAIFFAFGVVSLIVLLNDYDGLTKGLIIGSWNTSFTAVVAFWLGSSSAGKSQSAAANDNYKSP